MSSPQPTAAEPSLPSACQLAWLLVQLISALDAAAATVVARVERDATASAVADLARHFTHKRQKTFYSTCTESFIFGCMPQRTRKSPLCGNAIVVRLPGP
jgi:hypothetical protein